MFNILEGKSSCILSSQNKTYITIYTHLNETFDDNYSEKYLKYKEKYLNLKKTIG